MVKRDKKESLNFVVAAPSHPIQLYPEQGSKSSFKKHIIIKYTVMQGTAN